MSDNWVVQVFQSTFDKLTGICLLITTTSLETPGQPLSAPW